MAPGAGQGAQGGATDGANFIGYVGRVNGCIFYIIELQFQENPRLIKGWWVYIKKNHSYKNIFFYCQDSSMIYLGLSLTHNLNAK